MITTHERNLAAERMSAREAMKVVLDKMGRGEALSVEDRTALDTANERISGIEAELRTIDEARKLSAATEVTDAPPAPAKTADEIREENWSRYIRSGDRSGVEEFRAAPDASPPNGQFVSTNSAGGYTVPPGWWQRLQVALKAFGATADDYEQVVTESGQPMNWATVNPTAVVGTLLAEATQVQEQDYAFGQGILGAYMYTSGAQLVSLQLANDSAFNLDGFVQARVGESLGRARAAATITGTGSSQPLGIIPALGAVGSTGTSGGTIAQTGGFLTLAAAGAVKNFAGSTTELIANTLNPTSLMSMIASVDPAYRSMGAKFYFNDPQLLGLRSQVDSQGRPLVNLQDGLTQGSYLTTLYGYPVCVDPNIPALTASTAGGPIFGHLQSAMVLRTVNQAGLLRLTERYADFLQVGFIGYMRFDSRSNDLRAAVTVKPAAT
jgi:HK97 family phage major capsid protein